MKNIHYLYIALLIFVSFVSSQWVFAQKSISLTSPNGGEEICAGNNMLIEWNSNDIQTVRIELSDDGGITFPYLLIASTDAASGRWMWEIPFDQSTGTQYRIRIADALNIIPADTSNNNFTIHGRVGISQNPEPLSICPNETAIFRVTAVGESLRYQWRKDGADISGATMPAYYINNASEDNQGYYTCRIIDICDTAVSDSALLDIKDTPEILDNPVGDTLCLGESITLKVDAKGLALNFRWNKNGKHIVGSNTPELILNNVTKADSGSYVCIVSGACQPHDTSEPALVVVYDYPRIIEMPKSQNAIIGDTVIFNVKAAGDALHYQWRKNGNDIPDSTSNTLTLDFVTKTDSGSYTCIITNKCGTLTTKAAILTVSEAEKPHIELSPNKINFGNVAVGDAKDTLLLNVIHNSSRVPLIINSIKIIGPDASDFNVFGITFPITIPAEDYRNINIEFVPASLGVKTATITFNTNADNTVSMSLIGYGIKRNEVITANDWDFGNVLIGENKTSKNIIKNIGNETITIQKPIVMSYDSLNFRLLDEEDYPKTIAAGDSAETNFMFVPTVEKTYEVQVLVKNSSQYDLWFRLKGRGLLTSVDENPINNEELLYPNPAAEYCEFRISRRDIYSIEITDMIGNTVNSFTHKTGNFTWDLRQSNGKKCSSGIYLIKLILNNKIYVKKLIIF